jgi:Na+/H+ antiporter NhaD/arsenite permease-like protein
MSETASTPAPPSARGPFFRRMALLVGASAAANVLGRWAGLDPLQALSASVFLAVLLGTLFFWEFRLAIAFLGVAVLIFTKALSLPHFVEAAALPVILFLVGMMIVVGALRDLGFFTWIVQGILSIPRITARRFMFVAGVASALLACVVDEVTSIIFISALIFQVCGRLKIRPTPHLILCVLCTNVGSAGTMMGNPVGIYIGTQAGFTFQDFVVWAFPTMLLALAATVSVTLYWYRKDLREFDAALQDRVSRHLSLVSKVEIPYQRGLAVLAFTLALIASHHAMEKWLGLDRNSILLVAPLIAAGVIMVVRRDRARHYVEREVDWWTLLFFMLLFAIAGTLEYTGVTRRAAEGVAGVFGTRPVVLVPAVMAMSAMGSAFVDNVVFVAAASPVIHELGRTTPAMPLWWALLFGACFGGNITLIGSTANIVALGLLEKNAHEHVRFWDWLKIGLLSALVACAIAAAALLLMAPHMPGGAAP